MTEDSTEDFNFYPDAKSQVKGAIVEVKKFFSPDKTTPTEAEKAARFERSKIALANYLEAQEKANKPLNRSDWENSIIAVAGATGSLLFPITVPISLVGSVIRFIVDHQPPPSKLPEKFRLGA